MPIITRWIGSVVNRDPAAPRNDELVGAMEEISRADNPTARTAFYQKLLTSRLLAVRPGPAPEKPLEMVVGEAEQFGFQMKPAPLGKPAVMLFTDIDALLVGHPGAQGFVAFEARPLFGAIQQVEGGALINFESKQFAHLRPRDLRILARGEIPKPGASARLIAPPIAPTPEFLNGLREAMAEDPRIATANFFAVAVEGEAPRNSCGVKFSSEVKGVDVDLAMRKLIARTARTAAGAGNFDYVLIGPGSPFHPAEGMFPAFYTRAGS